MRERVFVLFPFFSSHPLLLSRGCSGKCQKMNAVRFNDRPDTQTYHFDSSGLNPFECLAAVRRKCKAGKQPFYEMTCSRADGQSSHFLYVTSAGKWRKSRAWKQEEADKVTCF